MTASEEVQDRFRFNLGLGGVLQEQKMLKGHLPRVIYHLVYSDMRRFQVRMNKGGQKAEVLVTKPESGQAKGWSRLVLHVMNFLDSGQQILKILICVRCG